VLGGKDRNRAMGLAPNCKGYESIHDRVEERGAWRRGGEELAMERHRASAYYGSCVVCRVEEGGVSDRKCVMGGVGREAKKELKVT
jgi:hypothetical protein